MNKLGIDLGTSTIKLVVLQDNKIIYTWHKKHHEKIIDCLKEGLFSLEPLGLSDFSIGYTGDHSHLFTTILANAKKVEMIPSIVEGVRFTYPMANSVIEIGSQGSRFITDLQDTPIFSTNNHCAGGTGSFFEDQMSRLSLKIEDYSSVVEKAQSIPRLSGRCAVFAKTDIIHRQQEGATVPDILLGLCYAMVRNYKATIVGKLPIHKPILFCGGVTKNSGMRQAILDVFKLEKEELIIPDNALYTSCIGASKLAEGHFKLKDVLGLLHQVTPSEKHSLPPLHLSQRNIVKEPLASEVYPKEGCYLGIDIGSTSTNLVLIDTTGNLIDYQYLRTGGDSLETVRKGLAHIQKKYGEVTFKAVGVTGSGRDRIGKIIGADITKDEITAQAKGASFLIPDVDTIFEIGGQDSKFIRLENGQVIDFQMNKICAAGTGSFIEEQATRMSIPIQDFGPLALTSTAPIDLGERCTVFIETAITSASSSGALQEDIASGLCYSIVKNYLHKVVGSKNIGNKIVLQGGVDYNPAIVAAFETLCDKEVTVNPYFSISGAFGVAILAKEEGIEASRFKGFDFTNEIIENEVQSIEIKKNIHFYSQANKLLLEGYTGEIDPNKKTVGIPYVLMIHKFFPMANAFFRSLGYNVLLTDPTNEETIRLSQENARGETCYPVKLIYGHMQQLIDKKVDYIFLPTIHTMKHACSHVEHNYGCVYMQTAAVSIAKALEIEKHGITLLCPVFDLDFGKDAMATAMLELGRVLNKPKPFCLKALMSGAMAVKKHTVAVEKQGQALLQNLQPNDKVLVLITRNYGISDPILNMGIPEKLLERGYKVITLSHLPAHDLDISQEYPNVYWPFGQHILSGAKIVANHPNLYAVYLTNHGCGPDTMLSHLFQKEMKDKPYLQIEVDEHFSPVGVITRIEAFLNSLKHRSSVDKAYDFSIVSHPISILQKPLKEEPIMIPNRGHYSSLLKLYFDHFGYTAYIDPPITEKTITLGRTYTNSKEYLSFTSLLGNVLEAKQELKERVQFLLPQTLGSETDGMYARVLYDFIKDTDDCYIVTLESLYKTAMDINLLFRCLLTSDLAYLSNTPYQITHILTYEEILDLAKHISISNTKKKIGVIGDMDCITVLDENILETLGSEYTILRNPMSEMFLFLWLDNGMNKTNARLFLEILSQLHDILPSFSSDFNELFTIADTYLPQFAGGNGRYRYAKTVQMSKEVNAMISLSSRYENTQMVLDMRELQSNCKAPLYSIGLDNDFDESAWSKLKSFLYYCK